MTDRKAEIDRFLSTTQWAAAKRQVIAGDASNRRYLRLHQPDDTTAILMDAPPSAGETVLPFIQIADHLRAAGLSAPEILAQNLNDGFLILEDFGDALFADLMATDPSQEIPLYRAAADVLLHLHLQDPKHDLPHCGTSWLTSMIDPVFQWYAPEASAYDVAAFKALFRGLAEDVAAHPSVVILRDYHVQNLLLLPDRDGVKQVGILDFQDAMLGHPAYDLVSILQDARRDVSPDTEAAILNYFLTQTTTDEADFRKAYAVLGVQRNLRILGIFARLCLQDGKAQYVDFIPRVWRYVLRNLEHPALVDLAPHVTHLLPAPTHDFLEHMKSRCPTQSTLP